MTVHAFTPRTSRLMETRRLVPGLKMALAPVMAAAVLFGGASAANAVTAGVLDPNSTFIYSANTWVKGGDMRRSDAAGKLTQGVDWNFSVRDIPPGGTLGSSLCNQYRCVTLTTYNGSTNAFNGDPADSTWSFYHRLNAQKNPTNPVVISNKSINITWP